MKFLLSTIAFALFLFSSAAGQCPTERTYLLSQSDVTNFGNQYPNCEILPNQVLLFIEGDKAGNDPIVDLTPLSNLKEIRSGLIIRYNDQLESLAGFENLKKVGSLSIIQSEKLKSIEALRGLDTITRNLTLNYLPELNSLNGLNNIRELDRLIIDSCFQLQNLDGLQNLTKVNGGLLLSVLPKLSNIDSLKSLQEVKELIAILEVDSLRSFDVLHNLIAIDRFQIHQNYLIQNLDFLQQFDSIMDLEIVDLYGLENLDGLSNLEYVEDDFILGATPKVADLSALNKLKKVGRTFDLDNITFQNLKGLENFEGSDNFFIKGKLLESLEGLESLDSIHTRMRILGCDRLLNLNGLSNLKFADAIQVIENQNIRDMSGFDSLTQMEGNLLIRNNDSLRSTKGFPLLTKVDWIEIIDNPSLEVVDGFDNLKKIDFSFSVFGSPKLDSIPFLQQIEDLGSHLNIGATGMTDFYQLSHFDSIHGRLRLVNNPNTDFRGLENLKYVRSTLDLGNNDQLIDLSHFESLEHLGELEIDRCESLEDLNGFPNLTQMSTLTLHANPSLKRITGLQNIKEVSNSISCTINENLSDMSGLSNLEEVGNLFKIFRSHAMESVPEFPNLKSIGGRLEIYDNENLESIEGIKSADLSTVTSVKFSENPKLSACSLSNVCAYLELGEGRYFGDDSEVGCQTEEQVMDRCEFTRLDGVFVDEEDIVIFPNPAVGEIQFYEPIGNQLEMRIFDSKGTLQIERRVNKYDRIQVGHLPKGTYFIQLISGSTIFSGRFLKTY